MLFAVFQKAESAACLRSANFETTSENTQSISDKSSSAQTPPCNVLSQLKSTPFYSTTNSPVLLRHHSHLCARNNISCKNCQELYHGAEEDNNNNRPQRKSLTDLSNQSQYHCASVDDVTHTSLTDSSVWIPSDRSSWNFYFAKSDVTMDKAVLKVYLPNGSFNGVKCGDATDIKVHAAVTR